MTDDPAGETPGTTDSNRPAPTRPLWRRVLIPALAVAATLAAAAAFYTAFVMVPAEPEPLEVGGAVPDSPFTAFAINPPRPAPDIDLQAHTGEPFRLSDARGDVVLVFFGYTFCPDICPQTMAKVSAALTELGPAADDVQVVFVSVDPERDTPKALEAFATGYGDAFIGVTGNSDHIDELADAYGVAYFVDEPEGGGEPDPRFYTITHSMNLFLIDREGQLRASFVGPYTPDDVAHDLRVLLEEADA